MIKIKVLDIDWKVHVVDEEAFKKRFDFEAQGVTLPTVYEIVFVDSDLCLQVVTHELGHAYFSSLCVDTCSLRKNQLEEVLVEMFAIHGANIIKQSKSLFARLKQEIE